MLSNNPLVDKILIYSFYIFSLFGIVYSVYKNKNPLYRFITLMGLGFFCSLPFSPAYQSQYMRYYPATIPLLGLLPAVGITSILKPILKKITLSKHLQPLDGEELFLIHNSFSILLVCFIIIAPLFLRVNLKNSNLLSNDCPKGDSEVIMSYYPGTEISVNSSVDSWVPDISIGNFKLAIHGIPDELSINLFEMIPLPTIIFPTMNTRTEQPLYVVFGSNQLPKQKTTFRACGIIANPQGEGIFYPHSIEEYKPIY